MSIKDKQGSITIGVIIIIVGLSFFVLLGYETSLMFLIKGGTDRQIKNISSMAAISALDENELRNGNIQINQTLAANKVDEAIKANFKDGLINVTNTEINVSEKEDTLIFNVTMNGAIVKNFIFFKNVEIRSNGITQVHFKDKLDYETIQQMTLKQLYDNIAFEVM